MIDIFEKFVSWVNRIIMFFSKRKEKTEEESSLAKNEAVIKEIKEIMHPKTDNEIQEKVTAKSSEEKVIKQEEIEEREKRIKEIEEQGKPKKKIEKVKTAEPSEKLPEIEEQIGEGVEDLTKGTVEEWEDLKAKAEEDKSKKKKIKKPRKKKLPTEQREECKKSSIKRAKSPASKEKQVVDLGKAKRKTPKTRSPVRGPTPKTSDDSKRLSLPSPRVLSPYVEINFDEAKIFLVLPKQVLNLEGIEGSLKGLKYELEINGKKEKVPAKVSRGEQTVEIEEKRIEIEEVLRNFRVTFPEEINGRTYKYEHNDVVFYVFISSGDSGKLYYLFDENGNMNPLPKRDVWLLLNENFELSLERDIIGEIEERWIWEKYQPLKINLKDQNELIITNRETCEERLIRCEPTFNFDIHDAIFDDFGEQSPIFAGDTLRLIAPRKNSSGWLVWIQNKIAGSKLLRDSWTGDEPLVLKLPDDLPCECGEFQIDICEQKGESIETLFFRYLPSLKLQYSKKLIIPEPLKGHKTEEIKIILENPEDFELKTSLKFDINEEGFSVTVPLENDTTKFYISQKDKPETKVSMQITFPRLRWKSSQEKIWRDKPLQMKRKNFITAEDIYLFVRTNSPIKHDILAILESNGNKIQESKFVKKGVDYVLLLNQFYDTIKKNKEKLTFKIKIMKDKQFVSKTDILYIPKVKASTEKPVLISKKPITKPIVKGGRGFRIGKGFSRGELSKAGIKVRDVKRFNIPYDKRRKTVYRENVDTLKR